MRRSEEKAEVRKEILKSGRTTSQNKNIKTQYRENKKDREREVMLEHIFFSTHSHRGLIKAS